MQTVYSWFERIVCHVCGSSVVKDFRCKFCGSNGFWIYITIRRFIIQYTKLAENHPIKWTDFSLKYVCQRCQPYAQNQ